MRAADKQRMAGRFGSAYVRDLVARKKRVQRARGRLRRGEARDGWAGSGPLDMMVAGVLHRTSCICYDCLYGEVRYIRRLAALPPGVDNAALDEMDAMPHAHRVVARSGRR